MEELTGIVRPREYSRPHLGHQQTTAEDVISFNVVEAVRALDVRCVVTPTQNGSTPRRISRFRPDCWTLAFSRSEEIHRFLDLSYGVFPVLLGNDIEDSPGWIMKFIGESGLVIEDDTGISRKS